MNKMSLFQIHILIHAFIVFTLCVLIGLMPIQIAKANAAPPPDPTVGGLIPYQPQKTNVQMMSETVFINVPQSPSNAHEPKQIKVNAIFSMRNQGQTEEQLQVIFPLTRLNTFSTEEALYRIDTASFAVKVNDRDVPFTTITTPPELTISDMEHGFGPDVQWAAFEVTFPVQQDIVLQVDYEMLNPYGDYGEGFTGIAYILETGAGWYGKILSAKITLHFPYPVTEEVIRRANPGYVISGNELQWNLRDFEPTREDNLEVRVIHVDQWQTILELRARVEQYSEDADAWAKLADLYQQLSIFRMSFEGYSPYYVINHHFADLTLEARQKVVALRSEWGNAHFRLAQILWYTNPTVQDKFSSPDSIKEYFQPDDPAIQEVLRELSLAWIYGFDGNVDAFDVEQFQRMINNAVPGLELKSHATATPTQAPPTETHAPTVTITVVPTVSPTLIPTASPIPIPPETTFSISSVVLIATSFSLAVIIGILAYRKKSKVE